MNVFRIFNKEVNHKEFCGFEFDSGADWGSAFAGFGVFSIFGFLAFFAKKS